MPLITCKQGTALNGYTARRFPWSTYSRGYDPDPSAVSRPHQGNVSNSSAPNTQNHKFHELMSAGVGAKLLPEGLEDVRLVLLLSCTCCLALPPVGAVRDARQSCQAISAKVHRVLFPPAHTPVDTEQLKPPAPGKIRALRATHNSHAPELSQATHRSIGCTRRLPSGRKN